MNIKILPRFIQKIIIARILKNNNEKTYRIYRALKYDAITCLVCDQSSYYKDDMIHLFCLNCGFHEDIARQLFVPKKNPYAG